MAGQGSWRVIEARFEKSAPDLARCPPPDLPEVAVAGRSNVGKSSLLNAFANTKGLARVSQTPGRTRLLNFFVVRLRASDGEERRFRWVDLPGYGFARAHASEREAFGPMVEGYLRGRDVLRGLLVLIDARRGPKSADLDLLEFCSDPSAGPNGPRPALVCATKCDKLGASERGLLPRRFAEGLGISPRDVLLTSAATKMGLEGRGLAGELAALVSLSE
jgi:GTP-binding protein